MSTQSPSAMVEEVAKIIDPEAFGLQSPYVGDNWLTDRDEARAKAEVILAQCVAREAVLVEALKGLLSWVDPYAVPGWSIHEKSVETANAAIQSAPLAAVKMLAVIEALKILLAAIDNMHGRGETFTARVSIAVAASRSALSALTETKDTSDGK